MSHWATLPGGSLGSCAPGYGLVRLSSVGHYPAVGMRLATSIPAVNYAGIKEEEGISRLACCATENPMIDTTQHCNSLHIPDRRPRSDRVLQGVSICTISLYLFVIGEVALEQDRDMCNSWQYLLTLVPKKVAGHRYLRLLLANSRPSVRWARQRGQSMTNSEILG